MLALWAETSSRDWSKLRAGQKRLAVTPVTAAQVDAAVQMVRDVRAYRAAEADDQKVRDERSALSDSVKSQCGSFFTGAAGPQEEVVQFATVFLGEPDPNRTVEWLASVASKALKPQPQRDITFLRRTVSPGQRHELDRVFEHRRSAIAIDFFDTLYEADDALKAITDVADPLGHMADVIVDAERALRNARDAAVVARRTGEANAVHFQTSVAQGHTADEKYQRNDDGIDDTSLLVANAHRLASMIGEVIAYEDPTLRLRVERGSSFGATDWSVFRVLPGGGERDLTRRGEISAQALQELPDEKLTEAIAGNGDGLTEDELLEAADEVRDSALGSSRAFAQHAYSALTEVDSRVSLLFDGPVARLREDLCDTVDAGALTVSVLQGYRGALEKLKERNDEIVEILRFAEGSEPVIDGSRDSNILEALRVVLKFDEANKLNWPRLRLVWIDGWGHLCGLCAGGEVSAYASEGFGGG